MADGLQIAAVVLLMAVSLLMVFLWPPLAVLVVVAVAVYLAVGWCGPLAKTAAPSSAVRTMNTGPISAVAVPFLPHPDDEERACVDDVECPDVIMERNKRRAWQVRDEDGDWRNPSEEQAEGLIEAWNDMYDRALRVAPDDKYMVTEDPNAAEIEPVLVDDDVLETARPRWDIYM